MPSIKYKKKTYAGATFPVLEMTKAEYDALPEEKKMDGTVYMITDDTGGWEAERSVYDNTESGLTATNVQDALDEIDAESTKHGSKGSNGNFNTLTEPGMWRIDTGWSNGPKFPSYNQVIVAHGAGDTVAQMAFNYDKTEAYYRTGNPLQTGGNWNPWRRFLHDPITLQPGTDLNDYHEFEHTGLYIISTGVLNAPNSWCALLVIAVGSAHQMVYSGNSIFIRSYTGSPLAWTAWKSVTLS